MATYNKDSPIYYRAAGYTDFCNDAEIGQLFGRLSYISSFLF
jgi:hypothetical protein